MIIIAPNINMNSLKKITEITSIIAYHYYQYYYFIIIFIFFFLFFFYIFFKKSTHTHACTVYICTLILLPQNK